MKDNIEKHENYHDRTLGFVQVPIKVVSFIIAS